MSIPPTASIVMTTFNGERFLARQLDSFVAQTSLPDELIVADDGSTDRTVSILTEFAAAAPFPVAVHINPDRLGFRRNFMAATARATGDLILFSDQDDVWRPNKVATIRDAFADDTALSLLYHNAAIVDADERVTGAMFPPGAGTGVLAPGDATPWHFAAGLVQAFRADLRAFDDLWPLSRDYYSDEPVAHDRWYFFLALAAGTLMYLDEDLLLYRQHGANTYGVEAAKTLRDRVRRGLARPAGGDAMNERAALSRVLVLDEMARRVPAGRRAQVEAFAARYRRLAARLERRRHGYAAPTLPARAAAFARSLAGGDYRGAPWGFNALSIPRDIVGGVLRGGHAD